jgi:large conductance mechanosensitive channel
MLKEFKDFIARGNVVDLAVAVIIGAAFGKIITSLVDGVIMPPIGLLFGKVDFASRFYVLYNAKGIGGDPVSLADAKAKGIPVIAYGAFINDIVTFLMVAFVVFLIVKAVNSRKSKEATTKDCPYCLAKIPIPATRCSGCCADLQAA